MPVSRKRRAALHEPSGCTLPDDAILAGATLAGKLNPPSLFHTESNRTACQATSLGYPLLNAAPIIIISYMFHHFARLKYYSVLLIEGATYRNDLFGGTWV